MAQPDRLGADVHTLIKNNEYTVSVASFWELINKKGRRDAPVKDPSAWWERYVTRQRTPVLPIHTAICLPEPLPGLHKDPYHRILMAQSVVERTPLVTAD